MKSKGEHFRNAGPHNTARMHFEQFKFEPVNYVALIYSSIS